MTVTIATGSIVCTIAGSTVSRPAPAPARSTRTRPKNASYLAAAQVQQSFSITLATQTISFTSTAPSGAIVGDPAYTIFATPTSGLPATFSADPSSVGICAVSGATVTIVGNGTCTINADQAGNSSYQAAPQVQQSFVIGGAPAPSVQSVSFTSAAPSGASVGGATYTVTAATSSGLAKNVRDRRITALSLPARSPGPPSALTLLSTCTIDANQQAGADSDHLAAPQAQQSIAVSLRTQTISFASTLPGRVRRRSKLSTPCRQRQRRASP